MPRLLTLALMLLCLPALTACPTEPEPADDDDTPGDDDDATPFDVDAYEVVSYDLTEKDGEAYKGDEDAEVVYSATRFYLDTPMRVVAIGAMFNVRGDDELQAHLAVWPDLGHNFYNFMRDEPIAEWNLDLNKDEHDEVWQVFELDEPLDIAHPGLLYVGNLYRGEPGQPVLAADDVVSVDAYLAEHAGENDQYPPHIAQLPERPLNQGFEAVFFAGAQGPIAQYGDLLVKLYVERYDVLDGPTWFTDVTEDGTGLAGSGSPSFGDCNDDGAIDIFDGRLRMNNGDGTFTDVHDLSGITTGGNAMWGDFDNDGNLDLFMGTTDDRLFRGLGDCTFEDVTELSGIDDTQMFSNTPEEGALMQHVPTVAPAWVDVNNDGWLDLMHTAWGSFGTEDYGLDYLWINQGDGTFVDVTDEAGMLTGQGSGKAGRTTTIADWDNDGDMDIFVGNYRIQRNLAWMNVSDEDGVDFDDWGSGTVLEGSEYEAGFGTYYYGHAIGSAWGDVDDDGDMDLFVGNLAHPRFIEWSDKSQFLRNDLIETGTATFTDVREEAGMIYQETDSSPIFLDYDNDGDLDLFYTTVYPARPSYLFRNDGGFTFSMVSYPAGTWIYGGWGVSSADLDNDGDLEIYGGRLFDNEHPDLGGWVKVKAVGSGEGWTNVSGIGARVIVTTDGGTQVREIGAGVGTGCQQPFEKHVGLGAASEATVSVEFPASGTVIDVGTVSSGDRIVVYEDGTVLDR